MVSFLVLFAVIIWCCHCRWHCLKKYKFCFFFLYVYKKRSFFLFDSFLYATRNGYYFLLTQWYCVPTTLHVHVCLVDRSPRYSQRKLTFCSSRLDFCFFTHTHNTFYEHIMTSQRRYIHLLCIECRCILIFDICFFLLLLLISRALARIFHTSLAHSMIEGKDEWGKKPTHTHTHTHTVHEREKSSWKKKIQKKKIERNAAARLLLAVTRCRSKAKN